MTQSNIWSVLTNKILNVSDNSLEEYYAPARVREGNMRQDHLQSEPEGFAPLLDGNEGQAEGKSKKTGPPPLKDGVDYVNTSEEDQMEIYGYQPHTLLNFLTWIGTVLTIGLLRLVFHWHPEWWLYCTHVRCSLEHAKKVLLVDQYKQLFVEKIVNIYPEDVRLYSMTSVIDNVPRNSSSTTDILNDTKFTISHLVRPGPEGEVWPTDYLTYFENKKVRYLWESLTKQFITVRGLDRSISCSYFHHQNGLSSSDQAIRRVLYGENEIVVEVLSIPSILFREVLEPFYIFQVFSVIMWFLDNYVYYASCIIVMSALSLATGIIQIRKNQKALRDTVQATDVVTVWRGKNVYDQIPSQHLVPGDVIIIPRHGSVMHCDAVLITGNCIVNESMLTGESVPVTKTPLPNPGGIQGLCDKPFHPKEHARHTLFCGTRVIQTRYYDSEKVKAVVIRTGFQTAKGELVRSMMFPKPVDFKFNRHIHKFIGCLAALACVGLVYTIILKTQRSIPAKEIAIRALDLITIVIPPALPAAMTIGIVFAQHRLKKSHIYCISPRAINISGCINCVCFDKTGTLTEEGLDLWGVIPAEEGIFLEPEKQPSKMPFAPLLIGMASCHSLTVIDKELSGDPLDLKMFESTEWELEEPDIDDTTKYDIITPTIVRPKNSDHKISEDMELEPSLEVGIVRQFPFSSNLQRMGVIVRVLGANHFELFTKGAPETIASLCNPATVPSDFSEVLMHYTQQGHRVIAIAYRPLSRLSYAKAQRINREELEVQLNFLGLLAMENRLKPETVAVLEVLKSANIRTIMVTGDNMLTALSVARDCGMIERHHQVVLLSTNKSLDTDIPSISWCFSNVPNKQLEEVEVLHQEKISVVIDKKDKLHLALTGNTFSVLREHYPNLLKKVVVCGTVFSRMAPEQKQHLVEILQELGYYVGMCGDGANDCGALKAAHAGISLSEAEASVASPFTSKTPNISCVPTLIREGRAAMVTSFGVLKYMACYSLTQFISVIILYTLHSNLTDLEFLYIDLFLITVFAALFGRTEAYPTLVKRTPPASLIGITPLASLLSQMVLVTTAQVLGVWLISLQSWYVPHKPVDEDDLKSHDNYAIFAVSVFQYITLAVIFSKGAPYRKAIYTNTIFLILLVTLTALSTFIVLYPIPELARVFMLEIEGTDWNFRLILVSIAIVHFVAALFTESFLIGYILFNKCQGKIHCGNQTKQFEYIEQETSGPLSWLPLSESPTEATLIHSGTVTSAFSGSTLVTPISDAPPSEIDGRDTNKIQDLCVGVNIGVLDQKHFDEQKVSQDISPTSSKTSLIDASHKISSVPTMNGCCVDHEENRDESSLHLYTDAKSTDSNKQYSHL